MVSAQTPARSLPADSSPANVRAAPLWHGKSWWCRHCFASPIAAADAETQDCRFENPHIDCVRSDHAELTVSQMMAWRILAETHSLTTTVAMMISRMSDTWVQASMVIAALSGRPIRRRQPGPAPSTRGCEMPAKSRQDLRHD